MQATVWDLDGWDSPLTVAGLNPEHERGYFAFTVGVNYKAVVFDRAGRLYIKADLRLYPDPKYAHAAWRCEAQYVPGGGIALVIPRSVYGNIELEKGRLSGYLPVTEV